MASLRRAGREYFHWPLTNVPADVSALEVLLEGGWHPLELAADRLSARCLVQGPDVAVIDVSAVTITSDQSSIELRVSDDPEIVIRGGGEIRLI